MTIAEFVIISTIYFVAIQGQAISNHRHLTKMIQELARTQEKSL